MKIGTIVGPNGTLVYVSLIDDDFPNSAQINDLPQGSRPTGAHDRVKEAIATAEDTITAAVALAAKGIMPLSPSEWTLTFEIGFKGTVNPIPVLVSGESNAVLKLSATWKRSD